MYLFSEREAFAGATGDPRRRRRRRRLREKRTRKSLSSSPVSRRERDVNNSIQFISLLPSLPFPFPFEELNATPGKKKGKGKREGANEIFNLPPGPPHHLSSSFPKGGGGGGYAFLGVEKRGERDRHDDKEK